MKKSRKNQGLFSGHDPARGSGQEVSKNSRVESRLGQEVLVGVWNLTGWGGVGSGGLFKISRVGPAYPGPIRLVYRQGIPPVKKALEKIG